LPFLTVNPSIHEADVSPLFSMNARPEPPQSIMVFPAPLLSAV